MYLSGYRFPDYRPKRHTICRVKKRKPKKTSASAIAENMPGTPGHQAPVRPLPQPGGRKFRISYCSQAEQKKEKVSLPGVRIIYTSIFQTSSSNTAAEYTVPAACCQPGRDTNLLPHSSDFQLLLHKRFPDAKAVWHCLVETVTVRP